MALVDKLFAREEIAAGRLVRPFDLSIPYGAYLAVTRSFERLSPAASSFARWLADRLRAAAS